MSNLFVILWMIFFHIIDDYVLQAPSLCSLKQKSWWQENSPDSKYKDDYLTALVMHGFSWSFMIMLPIAYVQNFNIDYKFFILFVLNVIIHSFVDNAKANWKLINLYQDQFIHMVQIVVTSILLYI